MKIFIDNRQVHDYVTNEINFNYDAISDTFALTRPFFEHWEKNYYNGRNASYLMFTPLKYYAVRIEDNAGNRLLTGWLLNHQFRSASKTNEVSLSGYSKTGILDDCPNIIEALKAAQNADTTTTPAAGATPLPFPVEDTKTGESNCFSELTLLELAKKLVAPYNIEIIVDDIVKDRMNEKYDQATVKEQDTISSYLAKLATLKNIVMRSTPYGQLRFTQVDTTAKIQAHFAIADGKTEDIALNVNGQGMHSIIYMLASADLHEPADEDAAKTGNAMQIINPLINQYRPTLMKQNVEKGSIINPIKAALAEELKNITCVITCKGFAIVDDDLLRPGDLITVFAPDAYIYYKTKFLIRSLRLTEDAKGKQTVINCILPEAMTGDQPQLMFR